MKCSFTFELKISLFDSFLKLSSGNSLQHLEEKSPGGADQLDSYAQMGHKNNLHLDNITLILKVPLSVTF
jgi:hypothetical protein